MKGRQILLDHLNGREAAALVVDGRLEDLLVDHPAPRPGTIYRAVADRPVKGMGGLFLRTPDGNGFLRQGKGIASGAELRVQITGYAEPGKAVPVTTRLLFKSRFVIVTPGAPGLNISRSIRDDDLRDRLLELAHDATGGPETGLILRSSCAQADEDEIVEDLTRTLALAASVADDAGSGAEKLLEGDGPHALAWRDWADPAEVDADEGAFERAGLHDMIDALASADVRLGQNHGLTIEPTRAFVAVDVNTGGDGSPAAGLKANIAAARDLPRQLRLRGFGGQVVLDPAPMPKKDRRAFETALRSAFRADSVETTLVGWTAMGHFELNRKRARAPLSEALS